MKTAAVATLADLRQVAGSSLFQFIAATALGTLLLFARAPGAYLEPALFAEDWCWTSAVCSRGFWDTALHSRGDYRIVGNIALIWLAVQWAIVGCGDVFLVPQCLALISYVFFAAVAALPILLLRRQLATAYRWLAWLLACTLPLGIHSEPPWSGVEILGRSVNVGYAFFYIAFVLLWYRAAEVRSFRAAWPTDLALLACTATNPLCIGLLPAAAWPAVRRWLRDGESPARILASGSVRSLIVLAVACLAVNGLPSARPVGHDPSPAVSFASAVEMSVSRGLLYPLVWPIYRMLSTATALALAGVAAIVAWRCAEPRHRGVVLGGLATVALASVVLVMRRGELAAFLGGYRTTFPDRYFYAQNLVAMLLMVVVAGDMAARLRGRRLAWLPAVALGGLALAAVMHEPPWRIAGSQVLVAGQGAVEAQARRAVAARIFVNADGQRDPEGRFVAVAVPSLAAAPLQLPRDAVERSLHDRVLRVAALSRP
jgi:hypothetical protein